MVMPLCSKWAGGKTLRAGLALEGACLFKSIRNRRATQPPAQFLLQKYYVSGLMSGAAIWLGPNSEIWNRPRRRARPRCIGIP